MRFGLGVLRLAPRAFWNATPRELHAASLGLFGAVTSAPSRRQLDDLMRAFPDAR
jgi:uncharacterized phage protein (TIGR02216 family)